MEEELVIELCVRGYHVYKDIWEAAIGEELPCERETKNTKDRWLVGDEQMTENPLNLGGLHFSLV